MVRPAGRHSPALLDGTRPAGNRETRHRCWEVDRRSRWGEGPAADPAADPDADR